MPLKDRSSSGIIFKERAFFLSHQPSPEKQLTCTLNSNGFLRWLSYVDIAGCLNLRRLDTSTTMECARKVTSFLLSSHLSLADLKEPLRLAGLMAGRDFRVQFSCRGIKTKLNSFQYPPLRYLILTPPESSDCGYHFMLLVLIRIPSIMKDSQLRLVILKALE